MAELSNKEPIILQDKIDVEKPNIQEPEHLLKPDNDLPLKGDPGNDSYDVESSDTTTTGNTQDSVTNDTTQDKLSTDLSSAFGAYGEIFSDVIHQLEQLLRGTASDIFDVSNVNGTSSSIFTQFLSVIDRIARDTDGARATNVSNALTQVMSYYMSSISGLLQNQFNIEQWQIQQDYNSPKNQLARLSEAGLNPLYAFGSNWSNTADSLSSASLGSANAASMTGDRTEAQKALDITSQVLGGISSVGSAVQGGIGLAQAATGLAQSGQKVANETAKTAQDIGESKSRQYNLDAQTKLLGQSYAFNERLNPLTLEGQWHQNRLTANRADLTQDERKQLEAETVQTIQAIVLESGRFLRENKLADKTLQEMDSRIKLNYGQLGKTIQEAEQIRAKTDYDKWTYTFAKQSGIPLGSPLMDGMAIKAASGQLKVSELANMSKFFRIIEGSKGNISLFSQPGNFTSMLEQSVDTTLRWFGNMKTLDFDSFNKLKQDWQSLDNVFSNVKNALKGRSSDQNM